MLLAAPRFHPAAVLEGYGFLFMVYFQNLTVMEEAAGQIFGSAEEDIVFCAADGLEIAVKTFAVGLAKGCGLGRGQDLLAH